MPPRQNSSPVPPSEEAPPSPAERQREMERVLKLLPGTLDPENVARRARAREAHVLLWLRMSYHVCQVEPFENLHLTSQTQGRKE